MKKIGEHLVEKGAIRQQDILNALERQYRTKAKIGEILLADGKISAFKFYKELADFKKIPFIDLEKYSINYDVLQDSHQDDFIERQYLPFDQHDSRLMIATANPDDFNISYLRDKYGDFDLYITSPYDILWSLQRRFSKIDTHDAVETVHKNIPQFSGKDLVFSDLGKIILSLCIFGFLLSLTNKYVYHLFIFAVNIFFLVVILSKVVFVYRGMRFAPTHKQEEESEPLHIEDNNYPIYSILIPLYREKELTINQLIKALRKIDYPHEKLDIKLIVETDDIETINIIKFLKPPANYQIVRVPYSNPRTKPKACNYALKYCKGDYVTIYDAEDQPDPLQLKKALRIFAKSNGKVAAVQSKLNYYNKDENLLTSLFSIEYASWFEYLLYGLKSLKLPIPLGGTSNHFPRTNLKALYAWDPFNVTEDADLGVRIAVAGLDVELINSTTMEESPIKLKNWFHQRTRWLKGYIQTFFVNIKNYMILKKSIGYRGILGLFLFVAAPFLIYMLVPLTGITALIAYFFGAPLPDWLEIFCLFNLYFGIIFHFILGLGIVIRNRWWSQIFATIYFPFYWVLHCMASYVAFIQFIQRPHHWNKTEHGLSSVIPEIMK